MEPKITKEEIVEMVRLWDVSQIIQTLDEGVPAEDLVNGRRGDVLLMSILNRSEPLFLKIMSKPFDFKKNNFSYIESAISIAKANKDYLYIKTLLEQMGDDYLYGREPLNYNTSLHIACEYGLQKLALILSKKGLSWDAVNNKKQTPLHILLRKVEFIEKDLQAELKDININKKDNMQLTCRDIITSFAYDPQWSSVPENLDLLRLFDIEV